ncbi:hypothetical protein NQZ68_005620 [Dissostichus eleginoides]|nr:hypothetical protein NQZ68_005620 [Dissostichus eleginoides]
MGTQSNKHRANETSELDRQLEELPPPPGYSSLQIRPSSYRLTLMKRARTSCSAPHRAIGSPEEEVVGRYLLHAADKEGAAALQCEVGCHGLSFSPARLMEGGRGALSAAAYQIQLATTTSSEHVKGGGWLGEELRGRKRGEEADTQRQQQVCESSRTEEEEEEGRRRNQSERNRVAAVRRDTNTERAREEERQREEKAEHEELDKLLFIQGVFSFFFLRLPADGRMYERRAESRSTAEGCREMEERKQGREGG